MPTQVFYDPFADDEQMPFDAARSFAAIEARYLDDEVEHDYSSDEFVRDVQALQLDAEFVGQFAQAEAIAARIHQLCGDDHAVRDSFERAQESNSHGTDDGHGHSQDYTTRGLKNESDKADKKKDKDKKKKVNWTNWLTMLLARS